jgi:hypothetical protein
MGEPKERVTIEGMGFTLFYDYDQLRDGKLSMLTDDGKIRWFQLRMEMVFLEPLRRLFNRNSLAYRELNSKEKSGLSRAAFMTAAFSVLLNGVEALGSFIPHDKKPIEREHYKKKRAGNYFPFRAFIREYMKDWDAEVKGTCYRNKQTGNPFEKVYLPLILWDHFRNGIAHAFVVEGGGIEYMKSPQKWKVETSGQLEIEPVRFFQDFLKGVKTFFNDVITKHQKSFLSRFTAVYQH